MKCTCTACGATLSLDAIVSHDDASFALKTALDMNGNLGKLLIQYLGLFRPAKSSLTFARVNTLLAELLPAITSQRIERNGNVFDAPHEAWIEALQTVINNRASLKQLKSHGYLYEVLSKYQPKHNHIKTADGLPVKTPSNATAKTTSKTMIAVAELEGLRE